MPGPAPKAPRLWLRPARERRGRNGEPAVWIIRDRSVSISTGYREEDRILAETALASYTAQKQKDRSVAEARLYLYFITSEHPDYPIKIGITRDYHLRLQKLQTSSPYRLEVLAMIAIDDTDVERQFHRRFAADKLQGEWFRRTPELMRTIGDLIAGQGVSAHRVPHESAEIC